MIKLSVMYPNKSGLKFDLKYYLTTHKNLLADLLGDALIDAETTKGLAGGAPGEAAPYFVMSSLTFESLETFQESFGANVEKILADLTNFTNAQPQVQISAIL